MSRLVKRLIPVFFVSFVVGRLLVGDTRAIASAALRAREGRVLSNYTTDHSSSSSSSDLGSSTTDNKVETERGLDDVAAMAMREALASSAADEEDGSEEEEEEDEAAAQGADDKPDDTNLRANPRQFRLTMPNTDTDTDADTDNTSNNSNLTLAVCHPVLFGEPNLQVVMNYVSYYRQLGADHVFLWHIPEIASMDHYEELKSIPYVTLTSHVAPRGAKNYYDQQKIQKLCLEESAYNYDWVVVIDADEFLFFEQQQTAKEFLQKYDDYDYIALGKWEYSTMFVVEGDKAPSSSPSELFGLSQYPFTAKTFCVKPGYPHDGTGIGCPNWPGRSKYIVRPKKMNPELRSKVHGHIQNQDGSIYIPSQEAHFKEFNGLLIDREHREKRTPESFEVDKSDFDRVKLPQLNRAYDINENGNVTMHYDDALTGWLQYVDNLQNPSDSITATTTTVSAVSS